MSTADYLIVGQGVAGSVLAWTLDQLGCRVIVADAPDRPAASAVAAGIVNPLTGRKLVRTWEADALFPFLHTFYTGIEQQLGVRFFHSLDIYRPFRSEAEKNQYLAIAADPAIGQYINPTDKASMYADYIQNPFGGLTVTQSGWVDLLEFTKIIKGYFLRKSQYADLAVTAEMLTVSPDSVLIEDLTVKKVIFCEGPLNRENPLFAHLPYRVVKGELLTAIVAHYPVDAIVNQGIFVLPVRKGLVKIGATYAWDDLDWQTTPTARQFLENKAHALLKVPFEVVSQQAGIRPSTQDRRPFVGLHPEHEAVGIFGGMGTKGVSLAPWLARQFANQLINGEELPKEVNIRRYDSLYA